MSHRVFNISLMGLYVLVFAITFFSSKIDDHNSKRASFSEAKVERLPVSVHAGFEEVSGEE